MPLLNSTQRFSNRVSDYVKYRPSYPAKMIECLRQELTMSNNSCVADIGSGTGILTEILLQNVKKVYAVEPNIAMRMAAEDDLGRYKNFTSVNATAEVTTLEAESLDFVFVAQAFHWFNRDSARKEFGRILKPEGKLVLVWNDRNTDSTPFLIEYEALLLKYSTDYTEVRAVNRADSDMQEVFQRSTYRHDQFKNYQAFKFEGLLGRLTSSSYAPKSGERNFDPMKEELKRIFEKYNKGGKVRIEYTTNMYSGSVNP